MSGCHMSWPEIFKNVILKCCLLLFYATTMNHFSNALWHVTSEFYMTTSNDQLSDWTEKKLQSTSQSQTCTTKRSWSLYHYSVLNPGETITSEKYARQIDEMHWQLHCLQPATERAQFVPWQCLTARHKTNASKVEWMGPWSFASSAIFTWPLANWLVLFQASWQLFAGKILPQPVGGRKCFPRVCWILKYGFSCYRNE